MLGAKGDAKVFADNPHWLKTSTEQCVSNDKDPKLLHWDGLSNLIADPELEPPVLLPARKAPLKWVHVNIQVLLYANPELTFLTQ